MSKRTLEESQNTDKEPNCEPPVKKRRILETSAADDTADKSKTSTKTSDENGVKADKVVDSAAPPQDGVAVDLSDFTFPEANTDEGSDEKGGFGSFVGKGFASYSENKDDTADAKDGTAADNPDDVSGFTFDNSTNWDWGSFASSSTKDDKENKEGNEPAATSGFSWDFGLDSSSGFAWQGDNDDPPPETISAVAAKLMAGEAPEAGDENDAVKWSGAIKVFRLTITDKKANKREYKKIGEGELKISTVLDEDGKVTGRLLCRRDKVMTTVFNTPIYVDSKYIIAQNGMLQFYVKETPIDDEDDDDDTANIGNDDNKDDKKDVTPPAKPDVFVAHLMRTKQDGQMPNMLKAIESIQEKLKEQKSESHDPSESNTTTSTSTN